MRRQVQGISWQVTMNPAQFRQPPGRYLIASTHSNTSLTPTHTHPHLVRLGCANVIKSLLGAYFSRARTRNVPSIVCPDFNALSTFRFLLLRVATVRPRLLACRIGHYLTRPWQVDLWLSSPMWGYLWPPPSCRRRPSALRTHCRRPSMSCIVVRLPSIR